MASQMFGEQGVATGNIPSWAVAIGIISLLAALGYTIFSLMQAQQLASERTTNKDRRAARKLRKQTKTR